MRVGFIDTVHPIVREQFVEKGWKCDDLSNFRADQIKSKIHNYDGIIIRSRIKLNRDFLQSADKLQFIGRPGSGLENIDLDYCKNRKIRVFRSPEGNMNAVAEHGLGMLLSLFNNLNRADKEVRLGKWNREGNRGIELGNLTVGLIGYGYVGPAFAKVLSGFGSRILAFDKYKQGFGTELVEEVEMDSIYKNADIVSLHVPLSQDTKGMVDKAFIDRFSKPFFLLNTARGNCVQITDLMVAIEDGRIRGACLDVLEYESSSFEEIQGKSKDVQKLLRNDKVLLSPHIAGWTHEAKRKMGEILAAKITSKFN